MKRLLAMLILVSSLGLSACSQQVKEVQLQVVSDRSEEMALLKAVTSSAVVFEYQVPEKTRGYTVWCDIYEKGQYSETVQALDSKMDEKQGQLIFTTETIPQLLDESKMEVSDMEWYEFKVSATNFAGAQKIPDPIEASGLNILTLQSFEKDQEGTYPLMGINLAPLKTEAVEEPWSGISEKMVTNGKKVVTAESVPNKLFVYRLEFH